MIRRRSINVHPINTCNFHCPFCFEIMNKENPTYLDDEKLLAFIDEYKPVHVGFVGGEPLLWPGITDTIIALKERAIDTCIVTNGSLLETLVVLPNTLSIGVSNDMQYNTTIVDFILSHQQYVGDIEITITPTDLSKVESLINSFIELGIARINLSMLAFWNRNTVVGDLINPQYVDDLINILSAPRDINLTVFGEQNHDQIRMFYSNEYDASKEYICVSPLNIYSDGHFEFCDLQYHEIEGQNLNTGYDISVIDQYRPIIYGSESQCKYCNLRRLK